MGEKDQALHEVVTAHPEIIAALIGVKGKVADARAALRGILDRTADAVLVVEGDKEVVHVEFEARATAELPWRMLVYNVILRSRRPLGGAPNQPLPRLRSVAVLLGRPKASIEERFVSVDGRIRFEFEVVHLYARDAASLASDPVLAPLVPFARGGRSRHALKRAIHTIRALDDPGDLLDILSKVAAAVGGTPLATKVDDVMRDPVSLDEMLPAFHRGFRQGELKGFRQGELKMVRRNIRKAFPRADLDAFEAVLKNLDADELEEADDMIEDYKRPGELLAAFKRRFGGTVGR